VAGLVVVVDLVGVDLVGITKHRKIKKYK